MGQDSQEEGGRETNTKEVGETTSTTGVVGEGITGEGGIMMISQGDNQLTRLRFTK
jgi:hypothetical protein